MSQRAIALALAAVLAAAAGPAAAQLRPTPQLGTLRIPAASTGPVSADYIVAVVNSEPITNNEVRLRTVRFEQQLVQQGAAVPPREQLAKEVLERLVSEKAQLQLGREMGVRVEDSAVDQAELSVARQNGLEVAELRRRMMLSGMDPAAFRDELRSQLLLQRVRDREVQQRVRVTEADIDQYLRDQDQADAPPELGLAQILVAVPEAATDAQVRALQARAERALQRVRAGEDFGKIAAEMSDAPEGREGGSLGVRTADRWPQLFLDAVQPLPEGGVSGVLRSGAGFHVLKLTERRQGGMNVAVTQSRARHILLRVGTRLTADQARARLADYRRRIQNGQADFAQLAKEFSQDGSAPAGGDLGWANPGQFVPEFEQVMNQLAPGEVSEPFESRFGFHLLQLQERRQAKLTPREQREAVRNIVREKKLDEAYAQWAQEVRGRAWVEFREPPT